MDLATAKEIAELRCNPNHTPGVKGVIDAIKMLRSETNMDLLASKTYLEHHSDHGASKATLLEWLKKDFVKDTRELLRDARESLLLQQKYVWALEQQVDAEDHQRRKDDLVKKVQKGTNAVVYISDSEL